MINLAAEKVYDY